MLIDGMVRIIKINIKRITENSSSIFKHYSVLLNIGGGLFVIPFTIHKRSIAFGFQLEAAWSDGCLLSPPTWL